MHPLRSEILYLLNEREASPKEIKGLLGMALGTAAYHCRVLEECGCVEIVRTEKRRGAIEHFFRAFPRTYIGDQKWREVPRSIRSEVSGVALAGFMDRAIAALEEGKIDDREDTTLNWMTISVDRRGWDQVAAIFARTLSQLQEVHEECRERLEPGDEEETRMIVGLAGFESAGFVEDEEDDEEKDEDEAEPEADAST